MHIDQKRFFRNRSDVFWGLVKVNPKKSFKPTDKKSYLLLMSGGINQPYF